MSVSVEFSSQGGGRVSVNGGPARKLSITGSAVIVTDDPTNGVYDIQIEGGAVSSATTSTAGIVKLAPDGGTTANTVVQATDSRLTNSRTPTTHASTHESGGSDSIPLDSLAAPSASTTLNATTIKHGLLPQLSGTATQYLDGTGAWSTPVGTGGGGGGGGGGTTEVYGTQNSSGDASTKVFTIAHGYGSTPGWFEVEAGSQDADSTFWVSADSTNITVTYEFPPPTGTGNVKLVWRAGTPTSGGSGTITSYSNAGLTGVGVTLTESAGNLPFKSIEAGSNKISVTDDPTNSAVSLDINQGNLSLAAIGGTATAGQLPSQLVYTNQSNTFQTGNAQFFQTGLLAIVSGSFSTSFAVPTLAASKTLTLPNSTDTLVGRATTDTLTNKTLTSPVISTITNTGTLTLPTSTDTLVGRATTDTLTNKTLTSPVISSISNTGTLTLPTSTDTMVGRATTDTLQNKTVSASSNNITDTSAAVGDILAISSGTNFKRLAMGSPNQVLQVNSGGTAINWATLAAGGSGTITGGVNSGTLGFGPWLGTSGANLTFYNIAANSSKIAVTQDTINDNILIDVNQANLSLSSIGGTATAGQLPATTVYTGQSNTFGSFDQIVPAGNLKLLNSTFKAALTTGTLTANTTLTLPIITDTVVARTTTDTLTNKTIDTGSNTITNIANTNISSSAAIAWSKISKTSSSIGDLANVSLSSPASGQVLAYNGTNWANTSFNTENTGTATASGTGSAVTFNIAHSLGSTPYCAFVICSSLTNTFTYTYDATNLIVVFTTAPALGTNNVVFQWKALS